MTDNNPGAGAENTDAVRPKRTRRKSCMKWGCISLLFLMAVTLGGIIALRMMIDSKLTPDQEAQIQKFENDIITLPADWYKPAKLPPLNIVNFHRDFSSSVTLLTDNYNDLLFGDYSQGSALLERMRKNDTLTANEQTSLALFLADFQPLLDVTSRTVALPDYTAELDLYGGISGLSFLNCQIFAKFASIAALDKLQRNQPMQAMETAAIALRLTKRPAQSYAITHLVCVAVGAITCATYNSMADRTSDTKALHRGLELLTNLRSVVYPDNIENWRYGDSVGALRFAAANGYPVNLRPMTTADYYQKSAQTYSAYYYQWIIDHLPADDLRVAGAKNRLEILNRPPIDYEELFKVETDEDGNPQMNLEAFENPPVLDEPAAPKEIEKPVDTDSLFYKVQKAGAKLILGVNPASFLYISTSQNMQESETRARIGLAMYDLTRIHYAQRLATLERPGSDDAAANLAGAAYADYLSPAPVDPFTSAPFLFSREKKTHYSVAPDRKNDSANIMYDATNGTLSVGDLWMTGRE